MSRKFNTKKFIKDVLNNRYALVIGNEIILDTNIEPTGDVHKIFLSGVNEKSNAQFETYNEITLIKRRSLFTVDNLYLKI